MRKIPKLGLKRTLGLFCLVIVLLILAGTSRPAPKQSAPAAFNKNLHSTSIASSLWVVANKGRILPSSYVPAALRTPNIPLRLDATAPEMQLRSDAATALEELNAAAGKSNLHFMLASGYRSYIEQVGVYNFYVTRDGQASADAYSARPGHSEHQLGLSADVEPASRNCELDECFGNTPEGKWLAANAWHYGFIIRYQKGKDKITGYAYEPWHIRYVGPQLAAQINKTGQTLEQFFGLPTYSDYPAKSVQLQL